MRDTLTKFNSSLLTDWSNGYTIRVGRPPPKQGARKKELRHVCDKGQLQGLVLVAALVIRQLPLSSREARGKLLGRVSRCLQRNKSKRMFMSFQTVKGLILTMFVSLLSVPAHAQDTRGAILGRITDPTGAVW